MNVASNMALDRVAAVRIDRFTWTIGSSACFGAATQLHVMVHKPSGFLPIGRAAGVGSGIICPLGQESVELGTQNS
jgi:hypothetical protein